MDQIFKIVFKEFWSFQRVEKIQADLLKEFVEDQNEDLAWCLEDLLIEDQYYLDQFLFQVIEQKLQTDEYDEKDIISLQTIMYQSNFEFYQELDNNKNYSFNDILLKLNLSGKKLDDFNQILNNNNKNEKMKLDQILQYLLLDKKECLIATLNLMRNIQQNSLLEFVQQNNHNFQSFLKFCNHVPIQYYIKINIFRFLSLNSENINLQLLIYYFNIINDSKLQNFNCLLQWLQKYCNSNQKNLDLNAVKKQLEFSKDMLLNFYILPENFIEIDQFFDKTIDVKVLYLQGAIQQLFIQTLQAKKITLKGLFRQENIDQDKIDTDKFVKIIDQICDTYLDKEIVNQFNQMLFSKNFNLQILEQNLLCNYGNKISTQKLLELKDQILESSEAEWIFQCIEQNGHLKEQQFFEMFEVLKINLPYNIKSQFFQFLDKLDIGKLNQNQIEQYLEAVSKDELINYNNLYFNDQQQKKQTIKQEQPQDIQKSNDIYKLFVNIYQYIEQKQINLYELFNLNNQEQQINFQDLNQVIKNQILNFDQDFISNVKQQLFEQEDNIKLKDFENQMKSNLDNFNQNLQKFYKKVEEYIDEEFLTVEEMIDKQRISKSNFISIFEVIGNKIDFEQVFWYLSDFQEIEVIQQKQFLQKYMKIQKQKFDYNFTKLNDKKSQKNTQNERSRKQNNLIEFFQQYENGVKKKLFDLIDDQENFYNLIEQEFFQISEELLEKINILIENNKKVELSYLLLDKKEFIEEIKVYLNKNINQNLTKLFLQKSQNKIFLNIKSVFQLLEELLKLDLFKLEDIKELKEELQYQKSDIVLLSNFNQIFNPINCIQQQKDAIKFNYEILESELKELKINCKKYDNFLELDQLTKLGFHSLKQDILNKNLQVDINEKQFMDWNLLKNHVIKITPKNNKVQQLQKQDVYKLMENIKNFCDEEEINCLNLFKNDSVDQQNKLITIDKFFQVLLNKLQLEKDDYMEQLQWYFTNKESLVDIQYMNQFFKDVLEQEQFIKGEQINQRMEENVQCTKQEIIDGQNSELEKTVDLQQDQNQQLCKDFILRFLKQNLIFENDMNFETFNCFFNPENEKNIQNEYFRQQLQKLGVKISEEQIDVLIQEYSENKTINIKKFGKEIFTEQKVVNIFEDEMLKLFDKFSEKNKMDINIAKQLIISLGFYIQQEELTLFFNNVFQRKQDHINYQQFQQLIVQAINKFLFVEQDIQLMNKIIKKRVICEEKINIYQFFQIIYEFCANFLTDKDIQFLYQYMDNQKQGKISKNKIQNFLLQKTENKDDIAIILAKIKLSRNMNLIDLHNLFTNGLQYSRIPFSNSQIQNNLNQNKQNLQRILFDKQNLNLDEQNLLNLQANDNPSCQIMEIQFKPSVIQIPNFQYSNDIVGYHQRILIYNFEEQKICSQIYINEGTIQISQKFIKLKTPKNQFFIKSKKEQKMCLYIENILDIKFNQKVFQIQYGWYCIDLENIQQQNQSILQFIYPTQKQDYQQKSKRSICSLSASKNKLDFKVINFDKIKIRNKQYLDSIPHDIILNKQNVDFFVSFRSFQAYQILQLENKQLSQPDQIFIQQQFINLLMINDLFTDVSLFWSQDIQPKLDMALNMNKQVGNLLSQIFKKMFTEIQFVLNEFTYDLQTENIQRNYLIQNEKLIQRQNLKNELIQNLKKECLNESEFIQDSIYKTIEFENTILNQLNFLNEIQLDFVYTLSQIKI